MWMNPNPVAFTIFGAPIFWYGIMISTGMLVALLVTLRRTSRYGITEDRLISFLLWAVPAALVGARIGFVIFNLELYSHNWLTVFAFREGGLSIHGGVFAAILTGYIYTKRTNTDFWRLADLCAPGLILGQAIGRWGNFFNQEAYGVETTLPWAMYIAGAWRHPTFLYEFIWNMLVFAFLLYKSKKREVDGSIFIRYLIWYSAGRYFIEGLRVDSPFWGDFRVAQLISLVLIHGGLILLWWRKRQANKTGGGLAI